MGVHANMWVCVRVRVSACAEFFKSETVAIPRAIQIAQQKIYIHIL